MIRFFQRLFGFVLMLGALVGIAVCIGSLLLIQDSAIQVQSQAETTLNSLIEALDQAETTMGTIRDTVSAAGQGLETVQRSTTDVASAIRSTEPVFLEVNTAFSDTLPSTIETVQATLPNLIQVADTVDQAMRVLSGFDLNETLGGGVLELPDFQILGRTIEVPDVELPAIPLNFDLGVEYDPTTPFDESLVGIEQELDGIPESMRAVAINLSITQQSVLTIAHDVDAITADLELINTQVALLPAQIDTYNDSIAQVKANLVVIEQQFGEQIGRGTLIISAMLAWFALMQLAPLYLGWELLSGRRVRPIQHQQ